MYIRNDGKGESNITQNGFTAYLLSAVAHRKADYLHAKQRRQAREVLTDPDDLSTEESPGISDPTDLLCCIENAALEEVLNRISERDRYIFFSRALHGRSFHELALELDLGYQGVAAAYHRVCKKVKEATGRDVKGLGSLLEQYGTYEMNGIAFQDHDEIWWLETIGGHHWMAVKVPDDHYVAMPNQLGIDHFDLEDALGEQKEYMCSADLKEFIETYHLDLSMDGNFNPRDAFGSHDDSDHVYNTPRAWFMERYLNPHTKKWDGPDADYTPVSDDIPWMMVPEKKITVEDVKYVLSSHYQGTPYDPYAAYGDKSWKGAYRSIGVNRTDFLSVIQMRPDHKGDNGILQWIAFASNAFNVLVPFYTDVTTTPEYLSNTTGEVSTDNFYWASRMVAAMADASYKSSIFHIERYQEKVMAKGHALIHQYDALLAGETDETKQTQLREEANNKIAEMLKKETGATLHKVLFELSNQMKNAYSRSDA